MPRKLYEILGIDEHASELQIKKAYRNLALKEHPDKHMNSEQARKTAEKKFKHIVHAYEMLSNANIRKNYDAGLVDENNKPIIQAETSPQPRPQPQTAQPAAAPKVQPKKRPATEAPLNDLFKKHKRAHTFQNQPSFETKANYNNRPSQAADYYFFNCPKAAQSVRVSRNRPVFIYVTHSPLDILMNAINLQMQQSLARDRQRQSHGFNHCSMEFTNSRDSYAFINASQSMRMERIIDNLIGKMFYLELMRELHALTEDTFEEENAFRPSPFRFSPF